MHFNPLLPALLLAQPSFAYWCCFQANGAFANTAEFIPSNSLPRYNWTPGAGCVLNIDRTGKSCKDWKAEPQGGTCGYYGLTTYGVVDQKACRK